MLDRLLGAPLARRNLLRLSGAALLLPIMPRLSFAAPRAGAGLGFLQTRMPFWGGAGLSPGGRTLTCAMTAESPFTAIQLVFLNSDLAAHRADSICVAPTSALGDATNPINASGAQDASLWRPVTFGGQRAGNMPSGVQGTTSVIPQNDIVAGLVVSDVIPLVSLPRTDGAFPLLLTRVFSSGAMPCAINGDVMALSPVGGGAFDAASNGRIVRSGVIGGDAATNPGNAQGAPGYALAPTAIIFHTIVAGLSVMVGGDSLYQGFGTATFQNDPFHIAACSISTPSLPVTVAKVAYQGMSSAVFQANLQQMISACSPNMAFIKGESPNDKLHGTPQGYPTSLNGLITLGTWCSNRGIPPVCTTAMPFGENAGTDPMRISYNNTIRNSGWLYADFDAAVSDGRSPASLQPQFDSLARMPHPNDAGDFAIAATVAAVMRKYLIT